MCLFLVLQLRMELKRLIMHKGWRLCFDRLDLDNNINDMSRKMYTSKHHCYQNTDLELFDVRIALDVWIDYILGYYNALDPTAIHNWLLDVHGCGIIHIWSTPRNKLTQMDVHSSRCCVFRLTPHVLSVSAVLSFLWVHCHSDRRHLPLPSWHPASGVLGNQWPIRRKAV